IYIATKYGRVHLAGIKSAVIRILCTDYRRFLAVVEQVLKTEIILKFSRGIFNVCEEQKIVRCPLWNTVQVFRGNATQVRQPLLANPLTGRVEKPLFVACLVVHAGKRSVFGKQRAL